MKKGFDLWKCPFCENDSINNDEMFWNDNEIIRGFQCYHEDCGRDWEAIYSFKCLSGDDLKLIDRDIDDGREEPKTFQKAVKIDRAVITDDVIRFLKKYWPQLRFEEKGAKGRLIVLITKNEATIGLEVIRFDT